MIKQLTEKGEHLQQAMTKKSKRISSILVQLSQGSRQLQDICKEHTKRLMEADALVKWAHLMDGATKQADITEAALMLDDYGVGETALKELLTKHEVFTLVS